MQCVPNADGDISVQFLRLDGADIGSPVLIDCGKDSTSGLQNHTINVKLPQQPDLYTWAGAFSDGSGIGGFFNEAPVGNPTQCIDPPHTLVFTVSTR
jgi:hypothetical protein